MSRHLYTPREFATMKWELTKACIDLALRDAVFETGKDRCFHGSPNSGYWFALDHSRNAPHQPDLVPLDQRWAMVHYRLPPVARNRASVEPAVMEDYLGDKVRTFDPWGAAEPGVFPLQGLYASWVEEVEHAFVDWDKLPDERDSRRPLADSTSSY